MHISKVSNAIPSSVLRISLGFFEVQTSGRNYFRKPFETETNVLGSVR
jgi:hypothetical protein